MNRKQVQADIRQYIEFSYDSDIPALEQELLAKGYSRSQLDIIREAKEAVDEWWNFTSEYDFDSINNEVNNMIEKTTEKVIGKVITPVAKKATVSSIAEAKKPASPAPKAVPATAPAPKAVPATAPAVKAEPATAPAVKAEPADKPAKAKFNGSDKYRLLAGTSKSSIGKFIINKINGNPEITGDQLADAIVDEFITKTGIKPDLKWARRNIREFTDKGLIEVR